MGLRLPESETEFRNALVDAANVGALKALVHTHQVAPYLSRRDANRKYGEKNVKKWIDAGLVNLIQDGPNMKYRLSVIELEAASSVSNRAIFFTCK